jgi:hypothetical protein
LGRPGSLSTTSDGPASASCTKEWASPCPPSSPRSGASGACSPGRRTRQPDVAVRANGPEHTERLLADLRGWLEGVTDDIGRHADDHTGYSGSSPGEPNDPIATRLPILTYQSGPNGDKGSLVQGPSAP